jgi:hypothetical protein
MNWSSSPRLDGRLPGIVCALMRMGLCVMAVAGGQPRSLADVPPLYLTNSFVPSSALGLAWDPSPDITVVGYFLCWGTSRGQCTNQLDVGNQTSATVGGFTTSTIYYFDVVAYNGIGLQADPSNEVQYSITNSTAATGPRIAIQPSLSGTNLTAICLSFPVSAGATYAVLATQNFVQWDTICTTNCAENLTVLRLTLDVTNHPMGFYRLVRMSNKPPQAYRDSSAQ